MWGGQPPFPLGRGRQWGRQEGGGTAGSRAEDWDEGIGHRVISAQIYGFPALVFDKKCESFSRTEAHSLTWGIMLQPKVDVLEQQLFI